MNSLIIGIAAGYLIADPRARHEVGKLVQQVLGKGIDALNTVGNAAAPTQGGERDVLPPAQESHD